MRGARGGRCCLATVINAVVNLLPLLAILTGDRVPFYAWAVLSGLAASLFFPATGAYVAISAPEASRGSAFGWMTLFTHTGVASGPAIGGLMWDAGGPAPTYLAAVGDQCGRGRRLALRAGQRSRSTCGSATCRR